MTYINVARGRVLTMFTLFGMDMDFSDTFPGKASWECYNCEYEGLSIDIPGRSTDDCHISLWGSVFLEHELMEGENIDEYTDEEYVDSCDIHISFYIVKEDFFLNPKTFVDMLKYLALFVDSGKIGW